MMQGLFLLVITIIIFWIWYSGVRAMETALMIARNACHEAGVQFLDGSVYLKKIWPIRLANGWVGMLRFYRFDYTDTGNERLSGLVVLAGSDLEYLQMENHTIVTTNPDQPD
ncbi:MAG: DUF3301 domain-containing protein [Gammaproteobacteria bacterium]|nr:MAG: DUF3301 domain-containing protein [Gammaproteobacteria bacterium]